MNEGLFYNRLIDKRRDNESTQKTIKETVQQLLDYDPDINRPGMLLGKIQSGKTRVFIGVIALAFDNGYDLAIILTKGTRALAKQTYERLKSDLREFIEDDKVQVYDVLDNFPPNLPQFVLRQKLVLIAKKETNNLRRITTALSETYPDLINKKILIVDDEADYASIGFHRKSDVVSLNTIAQQVSTLRQKVHTSNYLQVTATPYSLYLQPEDLVDTEAEIFRPVKPAFTVVLPTYEGYVGGDFYFEASDQEGSVASCVYEPVPIEELACLKKEDRRSFKIEEALSSNKINVLRRAILNFMVGACIRRIQQRRLEQREEKYSFVVHTEHGTDAHAWQVRFVQALKEQLVKASNSNDSILTDLAKAAYEDLFKSIQAADHLGIPTFEEVLKEIQLALTEDHLMIVKVNSEGEVLKFLNEQGELALTTPLNIFIGGQILDRGITIRNLIGFYYGRRPLKFQQDTVLQHSRMFGNRPLSDLAVTRFYTAPSIYQAMKRINEFDNGLRSEIERDSQESGVVFIRTDEQDKIRPCSPNKILLSTTTTLKPWKRMLPYGFQTGYKSGIASIMEDLDKIVYGLRPKAAPSEPFLIDLAVAKLIIDKIRSTLQFAPDYSWDIRAFKASMEYLSESTQGSLNKGKVWCLVRDDRKLARLKQDGSFSDAPDTPRIEGAIARQVAQDVPMLMLFRQNGREEIGWRGSPFWWPVLYAPQNTKTAVFASDLVA